MSVAAMLRAAKALGGRLPERPLTSRWWPDAFAQCGAELGLAAREPDWARLLAAYWEVYAVPGAESAALHEWLSELFLRTQRGVPACSEAEFRDLAAWFRASAYARRLAADPAATAAMPSGVVVSLWELRAGIDLGPGRVGSGRVAELVRRLRAAEPGRPRGAASRADDGRRGGDAGGEPVQIDILAGVVDHGVASIHQAQDTDGG